MGKAAKKERRAQKKVEELSFEIFNKAMATLDETEQAKFMIKTGSVKMVGDAPVIDPKAYYKTVMTFVDKLDKLSSE